jgi:hypothetical protein
MVFNNKKLCFAQKASKTLALIDETQRALDLEGTFSCVFSPCCQLTITLLMKAIFFVAQFRENEQYSLHSFFFRLFLSSAAGCFLLFKQQFVLSIVPAALCS